MASAQEAVRRLTITSTNDGSIPKTTADLNALAKAQGNVAVASSTTEKATLSLDQKFSSIERKYVSQVRAQQDYERTQRMVNAAVAQNPALQERANVVLAAAKDRHDQLTSSQKAMATVTNDLNGRLQTAAGSFGVVGQVLTALGPGGLAAAAVFGGAAIAFTAASSAAHDLAMKARDLKDFSEATGLSTIQVQALRSEATKFGVDADALQAGLQKFTTGFYELRQGQGDLLTQIRRINPALADQMAAAQDTATAFTLYAQAVQQTTNIFERNALARAGLGKGGPAVAQFLGSVGDVKALADAYQAAGKGIQTNVIDRLSDLNTQIAKTSSAAKDNFASIFAQPVLEAELSFYKGLLGISETAKTFKVSDDMRWWLDKLVSATPIIGTIKSAFSTAGTAAGLFGGGQVDLSTSDIGGGMTTGRTAPGSPAGGAQMLPGGLSQRFLTEDLKRYIDLLGAAATPSQRLTLAIAELKLKAKEAGQEGLIPAAEAALRLGTAAETINARVSALGAAASSTDILTQKTIALAQAQQQGAGLTKQQIADQKQLAVEQSLGVSSLKSQTDAMTVQVSTIGMSAGAAAEFTAKQTLLNEAIRNHKTLSDEDRAAIDVWAKQLGEATQRLDDLRFAHDTFANAIVSFGQNLRQGMSAWDAFKKAGLDALGAIADRLAKMAADQLWNAAFGGSGGGGLGNLLSGLLGGGSGLPAGASGVIGAAGPGFVVPTFHQGGVVGNDNVPMRSVNPHIFNDAPRFHLGVDEVPAILQRGERVVPRGQNGSSGSPQIIQVSMSLDLKGANGDETIARIAGAAAKQAFAQAVKVSNDTAPSNQRRYRQLAG